MNTIVKQEGKMGWKLFLIWSFVLFFLLVVGMTKYLGMNTGNGADMTTLLEKFPKIILAMFGMTGVSLQTVGGFYAVLQTYVIICVAVYSIHLGTNAVSRESLDKTYEFLFTKPRTRTYILTCKLVSGIGFLAALCCLNLIFSFCAIMVHGIENTITVTIVLYSIAVFVIGLLFFSLSAMLSAIMHKAEQGAKVANFIFATVYMLSVAYSSLDEAQFLKPFSPICYFEKADLVAGHIDIVYLVLSIAFSILFLITSYRAFIKRDLIAV